MKTSKILAVAALSLMATVGAQAEEYQGVQAPVSALSRADVRAEAVAQARAADQNVVRGSRGAEDVGVSRDRAQVRAEAVAKAHAPDQNVSAGSRVNSQVISSLKNAVVAGTVEQGAGKL